jgi:hypothetical protein
MFGGRGLIPSQKTASITGGTINGATIGSTTPAAGTFTVITGKVTQTAIADTTLSGAPKVFVIYDGATPYYFKAYPTKA